ncbi:MAG: Uma2 family endonuclease [Turicibacter sp.]|nr:Uma2 family endonuclease [Turicibacter sp.]
MITSHLDMANHPRHGDIIGRLSAMLSHAYLPEILDNRMKYYLENYALAYEGNHLQPNYAIAPKLYNVNHETIAAEILQESRYIQPDFMLFHRNKFQSSDATYKIAGCPDLIVEVWSNSNTKQERELLSNLYSTSEATEFWQIEQEDNVVVCSMGSRKLQEQSLTRPLHTQAGLVLDLTSVVYQ